VAAAVGSNNRLRLPAREPAAGDGDRWVQRQRPLADAGPVSRATWRPGKIHYFIGGGGLGGSSVGAATRPRRSPLGCRQLRRDHRQVEPRSTT
jgi:hypothetical protein